MTARARAPPPAAGSRRPARRRRRPADADAVDRPDEQLVLDLARREPALGRPVGRPARPARARARRRELARDLRGVERAAATRLVGRARPTRCERQCGCTRRPGPPTTRAGPRDRASRSRIAAYSAAHDVRGCRRRTGHRRPCGAGSMSALGRDHVHLGRGRRARGSSGQIRLERRLLDCAARSRGALVQPTAARAAPAAACLGRSARRRATRSPHHGRHVPSGSMCELADLVRS